MRKATIGLFKPVNPASWHCKYTVAIAVCESAWAWVDQVGATVCVKRAASHAGQAMTKTLLLVAPDVAICISSSFLSSPILICENFVVVTSSALASHCAKSSCVNLFPKCTCAPSWRNHFTQACGNKAPKSVLGISKSEEPIPLNIASCSTRKKTAALALCKGILRADRQSGSTSPCTTRGVSCDASQSWLTDHVASQAKPLTCQRQQACIKRHLSWALQPLAETTPIISLNAAAKVTKSFSNG